jgi:hypothetical protein
MDNVKNTVYEGISWSPDLEPQGPDYVADNDADSGRVSHYKPYGYDGLPDIAVPKHKES